MTTAYKNLNLYYFQKTNLQTWIVQFHYSFNHNQIKFCSPINRIINIADYYPKCGDYQILKGFRMPRTIAILGRDTSVHIRIKTKIQIA